MVIQFKRPLAIALVAFMAATMLAAPASAAGGTLQGPLMTPQAYLTGDYLCVTLYVDDPADPEWLIPYDGTCGDRGTQFSIPDLPAGDYYVLFTNLDGGETWWSPDTTWNYQHTVTVSGTGTTQLPMQFTELFGPTYYVVGSPVTFEIRTFPPSTEQARMLLWARNDPYASGWLNVTPWVTNGVGTLTFVPTFDGWYALSLPSGATNTVELHAVVPTVALSGPSSAITGTTLSFTTTTTPAVDATGQLQVRSSGGAWSNTGATVSVLNGTATATAVTGAVVQEFRVVLGGATSPTVTVSPIPHPWSVSRVGGESRYDVAVGISQEYFPAGADTVYVATGANFPDALGAAPAAALRGAPLLLVPGTTIPASVQAELERLDPDTIIVTGGPASVSAGVLAQLGTYASTVVRINGDDRYEVSRLVTRDAFEGVGSDVAYIATGATFPDALSASAAAGSVDAPVILVYGLASTLDAKTRQLLIDLGVNEIRIAGGPASVSPGIETGLRNVPGVTTVSRLSGDDRFVVSGATNRAAFTSADTVFIASGFTFPDALAGAAVAGAEGAPLYVIPSSCIPGYVLDDIANFGATTVKIFGGPASVTPAAAAMTRC